MKRLKQYIIFMRKKQGGAYKILKKKDLNNVQNLIQPYYQ